MPGMIYPLGQGMLSLNSKIRIRLLTRDADAVIDDAFWYHRLSQAWEYRKKTVDTSSCRLVFGEADFMPGIVIDKFEDVLVIEFFILRYRIVSKGDCWIS